MQLLNQSKMKKGDRQNKERGQAKYGDRQLAKASSLSPFFILPVPFFCLSPYFTCTLSLLSVLVCSSILQAKAEFNGQVSGYIIAADNADACLRYIPELKNKLSRSIDADFSANAFTKSSSDSDGNYSDESKLELYRAWARYKVSQGEIRLGLQKINFGPAKVLRSLMWFDRIDTRDPLELTDGVKALLGRYYFLNNSNIWLWVLCGNNEAKGFELYGTDKDKPEFGGRFQFPASSGEIALTLHSRYIDKACWEAENSNVMSNGIENRFALDGSWDIGPGVWLEAAVSRLKVNAQDSLWKEFLTLGADYTFNVGPGVHVLYEYFIASSGPEAGDQENIARTSALSADLSVGMLDTLTAIAYYDWYHSDIYTYLSFQRTYDNWLINASIFSVQQSRTSTLSGSGCQLIISYNH